MTKHTTNKPTLKGKDMTQKELKEIYRNMKPKDKNLKQLYKEIERMGTRLANHYLKDASISPSIANTEMSPSGFYEMGRRDENLQLISGILKKIKQYET